MGGPERPTPWRSKRGDQPAAVALFVYKRLRHLRQTVDALSAGVLARETDLYVFSDGPGTAAMVSRVDEVRRYAASIQGFRSVVLVERPTNLGLAASIVQGVTEVLASRDRVIVLEDDLVTSPYFLDYMNDGLTAYEHDERVWSVHGYVYPVSGVLPETFFLRGTNCLGWGTWSRAWRLFEPDASKLLLALRSAGLSRAFNRNGACRFTRMLARQRAPGGTSWAIRWHASAFLKNGLTLYPGRSLVRHIGNDESGTNCVGGTFLDVELAETPVRLEDTEVAEHLHAARLVEDFFRRTKTPVWRAVQNRLRRLARSLESGMRSS